MARADTTIDWKATGLVPATGLVAWHQCRIGESGDEAAYDSSGNERHMFATGGNPPEIRFDLRNGQPGWYFDGTNDPLTYSEAGLAAKQVFIFAAAEETAFTVNRGLLSGPTTGDWLATDNAGTEFYTWGAGYEYAKSGTDHPDNDWQAPTGLVPELVVVSQSGGVAMDGVQVGQQKADGTRKWKGYYFESIIYDREVSELELARLHLYFNLKFAAWTTGLPLYFPDKERVPELAAQPRVLHRFREASRSWEDVTDSIRYEDGFPDFNEVGDEAAIRWEYVYQNVPKAQKPIFEEFWNQARVANGFYFVTPDGVQWNHVRCEGRPDINHEEHKRWRNTVAFNLVGYESEPARVTALASAGFPALLADDDMALTI